LSHGDQAFEMSGTVVEMSCPVAHEFAPDLDTLAGRAISAMQNSGIDLARGVSVARRQMF